MLRIQPQHDKHGFVRLEKRQHGLRHVARQVRVNQGRINNRQRV